MATHPKTLQLLIERAERERDEAARLAALAQTDRQKAEDTRRMLVDYRAELEGRSPRRSGRAFDPVGLEYFDAFAGRLDRAVGEQGTQVQRLAERAEDARLALVDRQRRLHAMKALAEREQARRDALQARAEQKRIDEFANRRASMQRTARPAGRDGNAP